MLRFASVVALSVLPTTVLSATIPGSEFSYGNWQGAAYTFDSDGTFSHCAMSAVYNHGNELIFTVNVDASINVAVLAPVDTYVPNEEFPVALYVDRREPFFGNAFAVDNRLATLKVNDFPRALESFRRGRTLMIQSKYGEVPFDLTGTSSGLAAAFGCALKNQNYRSAPPPVATNQVDPAVLMQVATGTITTLGVTDFSFLSGNEIKELFPNADPNVQMVFWRSPSQNILSGVVVGPSTGQDLKADDAQDISYLATMCQGDFVTGARQLDNAAFDMREIRSACTTSGGMSEHYLTKFDFDGKRIYSWLMFEPGTSSQSTPDARRTMSESAALQTASYFVE